MSFEQTLDAPNRRNLVVGGPAPGRFRDRRIGPATLIARNSIEPHLVANQFLRGAPFETVSLNLRYGDREDLNPEIGEVNRAQSYLPVAVMVDAQALAALDLERLVEKLRAVIIETLSDVAANFDLPFDFLDKLRRENPRSEYLQ